MKKRIFGFVLLVSIVAMLFCSCRKPLSSGNGDNLNPEEIKITENV